MIAENEKMTPQISYPLIHFLEISPPPQKKANNDGMITIPRRRRGGQAFLLFPEKFRNIYISILPVAYEV